MKLSRKPRPLALSVASAVAVTMMGFSGGAFAQRQIEEVVITAERREATEQTTSISMEVFTNEDLSSNQVLDLADLQNAMPGVQIQNFGAGNEIQIRGVGSSVFNPNVQMGVQVVTDGHTQGEPMGLNGAFFDVGTIEVLRGPQGTFIGQSAAGGAILINSARPDFDGVSGFIEGNVGNYARNGVQTAVNLPINDTFAARIAFNSNTRDSFYYNLGGQTQAGGNGTSQPGELDQRAFRLGLLWQPNQQFEAYLKYEKSETNNFGDPAKPKQIATTGAVDSDMDGIPEQVTTYSQYAAYSPLDPYTIHHDYLGTEWSLNESWNLDLAYELANGLTINSTSGMNHLQTVNVSDRDFSAVPLSPNTFELGPNNRSYSTELNLTSADDGGSNWIVGVFASQRTTPFRVRNPNGETNENCGWQTSGSAAGTELPCGDMQNPNEYVYIIGTAYVESYAMFGQYNYAITDELELSVGARMNWDWTAQGTEQIRARQYSAATPTLYIPGSCEQYGIYGGMVSGINGYDAATPTNWGCEVLLSYNEDSKTGAWSDVDTKPLVDQSVPTYKIGLNWNPSDEHYIYAFYARGYKAGTHQGVNGVKPELLDDYELGWKGTLLDGAVTADLGVYYMDYSDMQGVFFQTADPRGADSVNGNIGEATSLGLEGSVRWFIGDLGLNASFAWQDSEVENVRTLNTSLLPTWTDILDNTEYDYLPQCGVGTSATPGVDADGNLHDCFDYEPYFTNWSGQPIIRAPELSYNLGVDYAFGFGNGTITPRLNYSHTDGSYADWTQSLYYWNEDRDIMDFSVSWDVNDWSVQAYVNNLQDEVYRASMRGNEVRYGDPRTYGVRARMNF